MPGSVTLSGALGGLARPAGSSRPARTEEPAGGRGDSQVPAGSRLARGLRAIVSGARRAWGFVTAPAPSLPPPSNPPTQVITFSQLRPVPDARDECDIPESEFAEELAGRHEYYSNLSFWEEFSGRARDKACLHVLGPVSMLRGGSLTALQRHRIRNLTEGYARAYVAVAQATGLPALGDSGAFDQKRS